MTKKFWIVLAAMIFGVTTAAIAHSSNPSVNAILGILQSTRLTQEQKDARVAQAMSGMSAEAGAQFVNSLLVTAGTKPNGSGLTNNVANALVQVAKNNPTLQSSIGTGMGRASGTMSAYGYTSSSGLIQQIATSSGLSSLQSGLSSGLQQAQTPGSLTVISPSQACRTSC